jgi:DNA-binding transcriptional LysR family regulator
VQQPRLGDDLTFAQLRTFACAARAGSFARAAEQLCISQPAVSEQIKSLEERLGRSLFQRRRGTTPLLSPHGEEALQAAEAILATCDSLFERLGRSPDKVRLRLSVGPYLREVYLRPLLPRLYRDFPDIEIELHPLTCPTEAMRLIAKGELDLAVYSVRSSAEAPPHARPVCELPLVMVAPPGTRARLSAEECRLEDFQYLFPGSRDFAASWAKKVLRELGLKPRVPPLFIEFVDVLADMVEDGRGIGHLMVHAVEDRIAAGRLEALDVPFTPMLRVVSRSPRAPEVARAVEEVLCQELSVH